MKEFVLGTDAQYEMLKQSLMMISAMSMRGASFLPRSVAPLADRLREGAGGLCTFHRQRAHLQLPGSSRLLKSWLKAGTLKFLDYTDMKVFLRSLTYLY